MKSGLFVNHKGQRCGVYQFGRRVFGALSRGKNITWQYLECDGADAALSLVKSDRPDIVVLNHHPATMDWAASARWKNDGAVVFSIFHEANQDAGDQLEASFFDFLLCPDPTLIPRNPIIVPAPRVTIDYGVVEIEPPELFTVGSFGFATHGKGFDRLCAQVNTECDQARIRLNIPPHDKAEMIPPECFDAVLLSCRSAVTKPGIDLVITHDFLDDGGLMRFLAGNSINAFFYEDQKARGISSCTDYALASGRPLAISKSSMLRHLHEVNPSICIEDCSLQAIAERGGKELAPLRAAYSYDRAGAAWESVILNALDRLSISRSVPDGRGFNKILDDSSRRAYGAALRLQEKLAPDTLSRKIARANIQQAFALDTALRLLPAEGFARILAIGSFEDTAVATLKAMGYLVEEIDPNVNGVDLDMFYRSPAAEMAGYDLILCVSVLEHVVEDAPFVRMAADLLAPNGVAVFTVDFAEGYVEGDKIPQADQRFYTTRDIGGRLMSALPDCALLDVPRWAHGVEDFEYEDCKYGFAGWVFRKFSGDVLRRSYHDGKGAPVWKQLLADTTADLLESSSELIALKETNTESIKEILCLANFVDNPRSSGNPSELEAIHNRLIYDFRVDAGPSELQLALKLARLIRKISWRINPSRRRKWGKKKASNQVGSLAAQGASLTPGVAEYLDSALITLAVHRRHRDTNDERLRR
jgi:SAM-dependent methyltransferase